MAEYNKNKRLALNMLTSFTVFVLSYAINFFLSPYIVQSIGVSAYGFIGLSNNFVSYISLITLALNALAGRFITVKIYEKDYEGANKYYTSVFYANSFLAFVMLIIVTVIWIFLEKLIQIPQEIFWDVKILFGILFLSCVIGTVGSVFSVFAFATNKLYLTSMRDIQARLATTVITVLLFAFFAPKVSYMGVTTLLTTLYAIIYNYYYSKKLLPFIKINRKNFDFKKVIELVSSGVWSLINRLGQILLDGLDLLIGNIFISATAMGVLSLSKTLGSAIVGLMGTIVGVFSPNFTVLYAERKMDELVKDVKQSMKIMGTIINIPIIILIVCGKEFFSLWQPTQNANELYILALLGCIWVILGSGINVIYNIFTVVNKLKANAIATIVNGIVNILAIFIVLKTTDFGIYAVAGVSSLLTILRSLLFILPYGAKCLNLKWNTFYLSAFKPVIFVAVTVFVLMATLSWFNAQSWVMLIVKGIVCAIICGAIGFFVMLNKEERNIVLSKLKRKKA